MDVLIPADRIQARVEEVAAEVVKAYKDRPVTVVGILTGCLMFTADLLRRLDHPVRVAFITASSYRGTATAPGQLAIRDELLPDLADRDVLLIDDILDTGRTIRSVVDHLKGKGARTVRTAVLLRKIGRQEVAFEPDFVGFPIPDKFVVGYGLDFNDEYRHLPYIGVLTEHA